MRQLLPDTVGSLSPAGVADLFTWPSGSTPFVRAVMVSTADGAARSPQGLSAGISSASDRLVFATIRGLSDVILAGAGTVRSEGYGPPRARPELVDRRAAAGQQATPRLAIVTGSGDLDPTASCFAAQTPPLVYVPAQLPQARRAPLEQVAEVVDAGDDRVDPRTVVADLGRRGLTRITCEGGPTTLGQFFAQQLVDELCLTITPLAFGGSGAADPVPRILSGPQLQDAPRAMRLVHVLESEGTLFLRYTAP